MPTPRGPSLQTATLEELDEFRDAMTEQMVLLERQIAQLRRDPRDKEAVAGLFRTLHTLKGDAALCHFELGVKIAHPIETVLARLREGRLTFTPLLADAILLATDRMELTAEALLRQRPVGNLNLDVLISQLERLAASQNDPLDGEAAALIEAVTGFRPSSAHARGIPPAAVSATDRSRDMRFFRELALLFESRKPLCTGRSERQVHLALATNQRAGTPIEPGQLEAAVYLHDIGMMFLPESIWLVNNALSEQERQQLRQHPHWAAELLFRMPGWQDAAKMIAQHHEMVDGRGYPLGLNEINIVPGAKILAIIDAFESVMLKHSHRGTGRSLVRAIAEVNASDQQFSTEWIGHFNQVVRGMVEN